MNTSLVSCALALLLTPIGQSQDAGTSVTAAQGNAQGAVEQELIALDKQFGQAQRMGDTKLIEEFLTEDFLRVTGAAVVQTKAAFLKAIATQATQPATPTPDTTYIARVYGDTAVLAHAQKADTAAPATAALHVFLKQQGRWKMATWVSVPGQPTAEQSINRAGYELMRAGKLQDAIELLKTNVRLFPESWNTYDSLGEAYAKAGETALAIQNYEKSIQLNPENEFGKAALAKLRGK